MPRVSQPRITRMLCLLCLIVTVFPILSSPTQAAKSAASPAPTITLATARPGNIFVSTEPVTVTMTLALPSGPARQFALAESLRDFTGAVTQVLTTTATPSLTGAGTPVITTTATAALTATETAPITSPATPVITPTETLPLTGTTTLTSTPSITGTTALTPTATPLITATPTTPLSTTLTLAPSQPRRSIITLPIQGRGYFEFAVSLTDPATMQVTSKMIALGVIAPRTAIPDQTSPFGVVGGLTTAYGKNQGSLIQAAQAMARAGIRYSREEFNWQGIEPKPGRGYFNFRRQDIAIIAAHKAGIKVLGLLDYWGKLPQPDTTFTYSGTQKLVTIVGCSKGHACAYTSHGVDWFAQFAAAVVNQYKPGGVLARAQHWTDGYGITDWEVWNEPSTLDFWRHDLGSYADLFATMYRTTAGAIHAADPTAQVMYDESGQNIDAALATGHTAHDILALHVYSGGLDPDTSLVAPVLPRGGLGQAPAAVDAFVAHGKPVWVTETGFATDGSVTPRQQAEYLVRLYANYLAAGIKRVFWFKFHEDTPGGDNLFGMVKGDLSPKPAYLAYASMTHQLAGTTFAQTLSLGTQVHVDLFGSGSGATAVAWSSGNPSQLTFTPPGGQTTVYDLMDNPIAQQAGGAITLPLSADPVFLVAPGQTPAQLAATLQRAQVAGIAPAGIQLRLAPGLINNLPDIKAIVSAQTNVPISGTVTLGLPDGWKVDQPSHLFSTLQPGQSTSLTFHLLSEVSHSGDTVVATATTALGQNAVGSLPATSYTLTYGHPPLDGTLAGWSGATESDLIDLVPGQVVGIPGWTPQNLSARIYTMWDERYFYLAADVHNARFSFGPNGFSAYLGDWFQYGWGTDPAAWISNQGGNRFSVTTALTKPDPATHRYGIWSQWSDMRQAITPSPTTGDLIYTAAVPWSRLGGFAPRTGAQLAFDVLINQYLGQSRVGWIQFTPGIRVGFSPSLYPLWTLIGTNPVAGLRLGGQHAPLQGSLTIPLAAAHGHLEIHDGGMSGLALSVNGRAIALTPGADINPLQPFGTTSLDLSQYLHAGTNSITANGTPARAGGTAVLSFFQ